MLKLKLQYFGHFMRRADSLERPWCWEGLGAGGDGDDRGWDGWMASPTRWTWVWANSGSWWWTGKPDVLRFMGSQLDATERLNWGMEAFRVTRLNVNLNTHAKYKYPTMKLQTHSKLFIESLLWAMKDIDNRLVQSHEDLNCFCQTEDKNPVFNNSATWPSRENESLP